MKLLIVDDEAAILAGLMNGIQWELLDFEEVLTVRSYEQAVAVFEKNQVDLMLSDIEMTDKSGLDLIAWVNRNYPNTECIILSCHDEFDFARRAVQLKCLDYVLKPVPYEILTQILLKAQEKVRSTHSQNLLEGYGKTYLKQMSGKDETPSGNVMDQAVAYIKEHIAESIMVETVARAVHVSPRHLSRLFQGEFHQSAGEYILSQRMMLAGELLKEGRLSVTMVSDRIGFGNYSYFIRQFRKFYGMTPREYQQKHKTGEA